MTHLDPRKEICNRTAQLMSDDAPLNTVRLLQLLEIVRPVTTEASDNPEPAPDGPRPISIWKPREVDGKLTFERPEPGLLGDDYALRKVIEANKKEGCRRICFLGESVAAGYLYAPHLTPAQVLEEQLNHLCGSDSYEVVDLSRPNETVAQLTATAESAFQLQPDLIILFLGNNWNLLETMFISPYIPSVEARQQYSLMLRQGGIAGPIQTAQHYLGLQAGGMLDHLADGAKALGVPTVLILPEVNLVDWENKQPVPWLARDGVRRWYSLCDQAAEHLEKGAYNEAKEAAEAMIELDRGLSSTPHRLLAKAFVGLGDEEKAQAACQDEIDNAHYATLCYLGASQMTSTARQILQGLAQKHALPTVDLRAVFRQHTGSPLPGRRLFLDYCHMTKEAIKVAMAAVTSEILGLVDGNGEKPDWQGLLSELPDPEIDPDHEAVTLFGAALHNSHRQVRVGSKAPILEHWCHAALAASPRIAETMFDYVAARCAPCPAVLTEIQQKFAASAHGLRLQHGWQFSYLDAQIIQTIEKVLPEVDPAAAEKIKDVLLANQKLGPDEQNLVFPPFFQWEPIERFYPDLLRYRDLTWRATYRSPWPTAEFAFVCDGTEEVELAITARLGYLQDSENDEMTIRINGRLLAKLQIQGAWTQHTIRATCDQLEAGVNRLTVCWPEIAEAGDTALEDAAQRLEQGIEADIHPVFGELFSIRVRTV